MSELLENLLPGPGRTLLLFAGGLLFAECVARFGSWLKCRHRVDTPYTRKIFHFAIFSVATLLHALGGMPAVNAYALGVVTIVLRGVWGGDGHPIFEAMARERDAPHRAFFVVVPMLTTAAGGLLANLVAGDAALVGYLVTGWGDAVGEPIGRWLGRHPYRVPSLRGVPCIRTLEGSTAVGLASFLAAALAMSFAFGVPPATAALGAVVIAVVTVGLEAISPHGMDNLTTMVAAAWVATLWVA